MIKSFFHPKSHLKNKIFCMLFLFVLLLISFLGFFLYQQFSRILKEEMSNSMYNALKNASYNFDNILMSASNNIGALSLDSELIGGIKKKDSFNSMDYLTTSMMLKQKLEYSKLNQNILKSHYLISKDFNYFYRTNMNRTYTRDEFINTSWMSAIRAQDFNCWIPLLEDNVTESIPNKTLSRIVPIKNKSMTACIGYLISNIDYNSIHKFFTNLQIGDEGYITVYNSKEDIIYHPDKRFVAVHAPSTLQNLDLSVESATLFSKNQMITYLVSDTTDLIYVAYIPLKEVTKPAYTLRNLLAFLLLFCILLAIAYSAIIANNIFSPINILVKHMKQLGDGIRKPQIKEVRTDELGLLYDSFNKMSTQIDTLFNEVMLQKMLTKELHLKNLQIQLSPHFLYNTLDMIHWSAREKDFDAVCNMIFLLSQYFRRSLSSGKDFVPIGEVVKMLEDYMTLQTYRFMDKLTYHIEIDQCIQSALVPKYLFQPILENAIHHGLEKSPRKGTCSIIFKKVNEQILFSVKDNGIGIPPDKLTQVLYSLKESSSISEENFALKNINLQLQLNYAASLSIESTYGSGTHIYFYIPLKEEP